MTTVYVARFLGVDTSMLNGGANVGQIVGGDTALTSRDGDTSYVRVHSGGTLSGLVGSRTQMPFRWERVSGPVPAPGSVTSITIEAEHRKDEAASLVNSPAAYIGTSGLAVMAPLVNATYSYEFSTRTVALTFLDEITDDTHPWLLFPSVSGGATIDALRVTYLACVIEAGTPFLRQRLRDRTRVRDLASRQRSTRVRGYL